MVAEVSVNSQLPPLAPSFRISTVRMEEVSGSNTDGISRSWSPSLSASAQVSDRRS